MKDIKNYAKEVLLKKSIKELGLSKELTKKITNNGITITGKLFDLNGKKKRRYVDKKISEYKQTFNIEDLNLVCIPGIGKALESRIKIRIIEVYSEIQMKLESFVDISKVPNFMFENYYLLACKVLDVTEIPKKSIDCEGIAISLLTLTPKEIFIISSKFGLSDGNYKTSKETSNSLGISENLVYTIEQKALQKLRKSECIQYFKCSGKNFCIFTDTSISIT